jgi:hypothetical protein
MNAECERFAGIGEDVSLASGIIVAFDQRTKVVRSLARAKSLLRCKSAIRAATAISGLYNSAERASDDDSWGSNSCVERREVKKRVALMRRPASDYRS